MAMNWTSDQKKVIETKGKNILVSAAAGSGKTTVLSERVIQKITDPENPVDVDRILVLTFTRAAAREMKAKITKNLTALAEKNPGDENLRRQLTLIHKAEITTIDSFCISIYKNYFEDIGADPKKKIVTEDELSIIRDNVMEELLEAKYEEGDEAFLNLTALFSKSDLFSGLKDAVYSIADSAAAAPWPMEFFDSLFKPYEIETDEDFLNSDFAAFVMKSTDYSVEGIVQNYELALSELDPVDSYVKTFSQELPLIKAVLNEDTYNGKRDALLTALAGFGRLSSSKKNPEFDEAERKAIQERRTADKKVLTELRDGFYKNSIQEILEILSYARPHAKALISLTKEFYIHFQKAKETERVMDFSDAEHMALSILVDEKTKERRPAAFELSQYFEEIMVDEYQDSNDLQEEILKSVTTEDEENGNYFCVGDVKQSIYGFRNANPKLFLQKYQTYDKEEGRDRLILLKQNFRSCKEVTDTVNHIFTELMKSDVGGLDYGEDESLNFAADFDEPEATMKPEIHVLDVQAADSSDDGTRNASVPAATARAYEAELVVSLIEKSMASLYIKDPETGEKRHPGYGDFAILSRTLSSEMGALNSALEKHHIPHILAQEKEFFETVEIRPVVSLLKLIGNRRDDISVAGVLTSPFYNVSDETLLKIRHEFTKIPYYTAVRLYAEKHPENEQLSRFFSDLRRYRKDAREKSIRDLIMEIYDTGYLDIMTAFPDGEDRRANLLSFLDMAAEYEKDNFKGLYRFNKYIELRKKYGIATNPEAFTTKNEVAVMTIHKSKGLEFPIVILFGAGKNFRKDTGNHGILIDRENGLFVDAFDSERRIREKTFFRNVDEKLLHIEKIAEEQRLLYVALTRAKEKLFITGYVKDSEKFLENYQNALPISNADRQKANNYFDFIMPVACSLEYADDFEIIEHSMHEFDDADSASYLSEASENAVSKNSPEYIETSAADNAPSDHDRFLQDFADYQKNGDKTFERKLTKRLSFSYPFADEVSYKTKYSVTEIRDAYTKSEYEETENIYRNISDDDQAFTGAASDASAKDIQINGQISSAQNDKYYSTELPNFRPTVPEFLQKNHALTGNKRGTAVHRYMECFDFARDDFREIYESELQRMTKNGMLSEEAAASISRDEIERFLQNSLAERMHLAAKEKHLFREKAFMAMENISELLKRSSTDTNIINGGASSENAGRENVFGENTAGENAAGENTKKHNCTHNNEVMVQGIIDAFFIEGDHIVLLDYKTDKTRSAQKLKDEYFKQLDIYRDVLSRALHLPVTEMMLYSFTIGSEISLL